MPAPNTSLRISLVFFESVLSQLNPCGHYQTFLFELHTWWIVFETPGILLLLLGSWKPFLPLARVSDKVGKSAMNPFIPKERFYWFPWWGHVFLLFPFPWLMFLQFQDMVKQRHYLEFDMPWMSYSIFVVLPFFCKLVELYERSMKNRVQLSGQHFILAS